MVDQQMLNSKSLFDCDCRTIERELLTIIAQAHMQLSKTPYVFHNLSGRIDGFKIAAADADSVRCAKAWSQGATVKRTWLRGVRNIGRRST